MCGLFQLVAHPGFHCRGSGPAPLAEGMETALLYVRFRAAAEPGVKGLLAGLSERANARPEYAQLLADCQRCYVEVPPQTPACINHALDNLVKQVSRGCLAVTFHCRLGGYGS